MAIQERNGSFRVIFRHYGKQHTFTLGEVSRDEAENKSSQADYLLMRLKQKLLVLPDGMDIVTFLRYDGTPENVQTLPEAPRKEVTLGQLKDRYLVTHGNGTIEASTLETAKIHFRHLGRFFGEAMPIADLTLVRVQDYVNSRSQNKISSVTIKKEITTLRAAWNWGEAMELTQGVFPSKGLRYPKADEKPPFMTRAEIEQRIEAGESGELWDAVYLLLDEITELLDSVKERAIHPFLYPMFDFAAHTGARRSEIIRAQKSDVDLAGGTILIHEKKRSKSTRTTRRVPISPLLKPPFRIGSRFIPEALTCSVTVER